LPRASDAQKVCTITSAAGAGGSAGAGGRGGTGGIGGGGGSPLQGGSTGGGTPGGGRGGAGGGDTTDTGAGGAISDAMPGDGPPRDTPSADMAMEAGPPADWPECAEGMKMVAQAELDNGLVVYVPFDDASTSLMLGDASANTHRITPRDFDLITAQSSLARLGKSVDLGKGINNLRGYVTVDVSTQINAIRAFTLAAWIKFPSGKTNDGIILSRRFRMFGLLFNLEIVNGNILRGQIFTGRTGTLSGLVMAPASRPLPQTTKWMHVAMTFERSPDNSPQPGMRLYIDGTLAAETPFPYALGEDPGPIVIGGGEDEAMNFANPPVTRRLGAMVDEVMVYNRSLSGAVIKAIACGAQPTKQL
jgi:hypothetical protein